MSLACKVRELGSLPDRGPSRKSGSGCRARRTPSTAASSEMGIKWVGTKEKDQKSRVRGNEEEGKRRPDKGASQSNVEELEGGTSRVSP